MAWFLLARAFIVAGVGYSAALLQPLPFGLAANIAFAIVLAALVVAFERQLRESPPSRVLGALIGASTAVVVAHLAFHARKRLPLSNVAAGLAEDALVVALGSAVAQGG